MAILLLQTLPYELSPFSPLFACMAAISNKKIETKIVARIITTLLYVNGQHIETDKSSNY